MKRMFTLLAALAAMPAYVAGRAFAGGGDDTTCAANRFADE
jgi:hypothetical protein